MSTAAAAKVTPEEYLAMPDRECFELVDGNLVELNVNVLSSRVGAIVVRKLDNYCDAHNLGWVWGADILVRCYPDPAKFRKPDACFVRMDRIPADRDEAALEIPPDLVVEVLSPNDTAYEVHIKIREYLDAGVRLVWVLYPATGTVSIHRIDRTIAERSAGEEIDGEDVVPGFRCPVASFFPPKP